jgi:hypothetical protein
MILKCRPETGTARAVWFRLKSRSGNTTHGTRGEAANVTLITLAILFRGSKPLTHLSYTFLPLV